MNTRDAYDCLAPGKLRGWPRLQAAWVDRSKRAALRQLHASTAGEILLLNMYLVGEQATERALQNELQPSVLPEWLTRQVDRHLAEEREHVRLFADAIAQRGGIARGDKPNWHGRHKIARWDRLARRHAAHFSQGLVVPFYAIGMCAEQMAVRILERHCSAIGPAHALHPLFRRVLDDEIRHVRLCEHALRRIVPPQEIPQLRTLLTKVRSIERRFGISSSIGMYLAGWICARRSPAPAA